MSVVTATILSAGKAMDPAFELVSLDIVKEINRVPYAQVILIDGSVAEQTFEISDAPFFEPGKEIEIKLRYEDGSKDATVFQGVVVGQRVEASAQGSLLTVDLKDKAVSMTVIRQSAVYVDKTDDKVLGEVIANNGLKKGKVATTKMQHPELVQYDCTDWDFMLLRADANGLLVAADDGTISLAEIDLSASPKHTYEYGIGEIYGFEIEANADQQYPSVESLAWDAKKQALTKAAKGKELSLAQGNLKGSNLANALGIGPYTLLGAGALDPKELQAWSDAVLSHSRMALFRGRITVPGDGLVKLLDVIEVKGIGKRFNGKTLVTGTRHQVDTRGWQTHVQFGLPPERFAIQPTVSATPAAGLVSAIHGLQIGVVDAYEDDPNKELRVRVKLPGMGDPKAIIWARLASPDAGKDRGFFFLPEPGDEVVVGFINDDPRQAIILGSMFGSKTGQPKGFAAPTKDNLEKGIVTKQGITVLFKDDKKASLVIQTPEKNSVTFDDDAQQIEIADQHGNTITMSKDGVVIKSAKDFKIDASGNVEIKGAKVDVK